jgi:hypothetical protein
MRLRIERDLSNNRISPKRATTGGSRKLPHSTQLHLTHRNRSETSQRESITLGNSREPPAAPFLSRFERRDE